MTRSTDFLMLPHSQYPLPVTNPRIIEQIEAALPECDGVLDQPPAFDEGQGEILSWFLMRGGFAGIVLRPNRHATLCRSWVHPKMRGLGLGEALYHARMAQAHLMGAQHVGAVVRGRGGVLRFVVRGWPHQRELSNNKHLVFRTLAAGTREGLSRLEPSLFELPEPTLSPKLD